MSLLDSLERALFDARHATWLRDHGQPVTQANLDGAWRASTDFPDGRRYRARAAAEAVLACFEGQSGRVGCHSLATVA